MVIGIPLFGVDISNNKIIMIKNNYNNIIKNYNNIIKNNDNYNNNEV